MIPVVNVCAPGSTPSCRSTPAVREVMRARAAGQAWSIMTRHRTGASGAVATVVELGVPVCLMHMQGETAQHAATLNTTDVIADILEYLRNRIAVVNRRVSGESGCWSIRGSDSARRSSNNFCSVDCSVLRDFRACCCWSGSRANRCCAVTVARFEAIGSRRASRRPLMAVGRVRGSSARHDVVDGRCTRSWYAVHTRVTATGHTERWCRRRHPARRHFTDRKAAMAPKYFSTDGIRIASRSGTTVRSSCLLGWPRAGAGATDTVKS